MAALLVLSLPATAGDAVATAPPGRAAALGNPDLCVQGYVWRQTIRDDHVCVSPAVRAQAWADNAQAAARRHPNGTCRTGWVWREAIPGDRVCVTPATRAQAKYDSERATTRWVATARPDGGFTPHPFHWPSQWYAIRSSHTNPGVFADVMGASPADGQAVILWPLNSSHSQQFKFRALGGGDAYRNAFQIVAKHSLKCLAVGPVASYANGAAVVQLPCAGRENFYWSFYRRGDAQHEIRALHSNRCLDADRPGGGLPGQGARLQQWQCSGSQNQAWRLQTREV